MTFGEWLGSELEWWSQHPIMSQSKHTNLLKLVQIQRKALKLVSQYTSLTEFVELAYQMNALEAALMGEKEHGCEAG